MAEENEPQPGLPASYADDEPEGGVFRWMSACVVLLAVAGFFGLAWYAYKSGGEVVDEKDVELVKADETPVKEAPKNPGGMDIPNQDKTVYGLINNGQGQKPTVERVLPAPEEPVAHGSDTETWMSDKARLQANGGGQTQDAPAPAPETAKAQQFNPSAHTQPGESAVQMADATPPVRNADPAENPPSGQKESPKEPAAVIAAGTVTAPAPPALAPVLPTPPAAQTAQNVTPPPAATPPKTKPPAPAKPAAAVPPQEADDTNDDDDQTEEGTPAAKADTKAAAKPPAGARVQLGAFKSEAEAQSNWGRIAKKFSGDTDGKSHYIVRADLGEKGIFYRLQVAPFSTSKEAEKFCFDLVSAGQGCFLAKGK